MPASVLSLLALLLSLVLLLTLLALLAVPLLLLLLLLLDARLLGREAIPAVCHLRYILFGLLLLFLLLGALSRVSKLVLHFSEILLKLLILML